MSFSKDMLILKTNIRKSLPDNNAEISKALLNIFALKFKLTDIDIRAKNTSSSTDCMPTEEYPLSDRHFIAIFNKSKLNTKSNYKILLEVSENNATVNYAPLLYPLISFLSLYLSYSETLCCIERLLNNSEMIPASKNDWNNYCHLLYYLGKKFATKAYKHISNFNPPVLVCFWPYVVWYMPHDHLTRIIPCYFVEGDKVLYRTGLLIWKECFNRYKKELNDSNVKDLLIKTAQTIDRTYNAQQFLNRMFKIRNFSRKSVDRFKSKLPKSLAVGDWISPTSSKGYIAFKASHKNPSQILTHEELIEIIHKLNPILAQIQKPVSIFCTNSHGYSLKSLYSCAEEANEDRGMKETLLIVQTTAGEVIGAFATDPWTLKNRTEPKRFFGRGECFVFRVRPGPMKWFHWDQNRDNMFQRATADGLELGGGGQGAAIFIDSGIKSGRSAKSSTFDNECLTANRNFEIACLELLAFSETTND